MNLLKAMTMKKRIAIFASGNGSNFEALAAACESGEIDAEVALCVVDKPGAYVVERAKKFGVPVLEFRPKDFSGRKEYETMIVECLKKENVELICLAGYMRIVGDTLLNAYGGRIINIHPSLLPSFKGADGIGMAMEAGVKVYGVTIHYVDATLDGGKIIDQISLHYDGNDRDVLEPMIHKLEHRLYPDVVARLLNHNPMA